jgi:hypothetical protein
LVQQDVAFALPGAAPSWPDSDVARIADLIAPGGDAYIVLSNLGAISGASRPEWASRKRPSGSSYRRTLSEPTRSWDLNWRCMPTKV